MARLVVLALVLLAAVHVNSQASRADVNDVRLNDLYERLKSISDLLASRDENRKNREKELIELEGRVRDLKGDDCSERTFRCSTRSKKCIHDMLCCDGEDDCGDGSDEVDCINPCKAGTTLEGNTYNAQCMTDNTPVKVRFDIVGEKRWNDFPSVAVLTVLMSSEMRDGTSKKDTYRGAYSYGQRTLIVYPKEGEGVAMTCSFRSAKSPFCYAQFKSIVSKETCGEAILNIVE